MQMSTNTRKPIGRASVIAALGLAIAAGLLFVLMAGSGPAHAATQHVTKHAVHHAARASHHTRAAAEPTGTTDADNIQAGDQTTPDTGSAKTAGEGESSTESSTDAEQGQPGEPVGGHQDAGGNVNNDCTGNCVQ
jgi:hypothetical protein